MTELSYKRDPTYMPEFGRPIKKVEISRDNIFITDENNRVFQVYLNWDETLPVLIKIVVP